MLLDGIHQLLYSCLIGFRLNTCRNNDKQSQRHRNIGINPFFRVPFFSVFFLFYFINPLFAANASDEHAASNKYRLVWTDDPTSTMTVIWDQLKGNEASVYYGETDHGRQYWKYKLRQAPQSKRWLYYNMNTFYAKLQNLKPDATYYFVIKDCTGTSDRYYFRTAPDKPKAFTFIAGGDTKSSGKPLEAGRASNKMVARLRPLFVMFNGDFNSGDGTYPDRWQQWLTDWFELTTTADGRMIPLVPVHGNHENGNLTVLHRIFASPFQYANENNVYYSLTFGGDFFHIIALNSELDEGGDQRKWLEADLSAHRNDVFKIAGYHKPFHPHTQKKPENEYQYEQWAGLFYEYGLNISLDGDSHMHKITYPLKPSTEKGSFQGFVRDDEKGTMFIGEGSWGAYPRDNNDDKPWTLQSVSCNQVKWIHVRPEKDAQPASLEIFTVITGQYEENDEQTLFVDAVESLSESDVFQIPANIKFFVGNDSLKSVKYPFYLNNQ
ncbi:MAG: metallophosphoesterase family protein [Deferribacteres bacterium]|nr:metallophosphoesterase family protein [candidate division KSB1 bacterium]MCB9500520.1 metallophosphoesterase family protein [Deferribacteres bacterium]